MFEIGHTVKIIANGDNYRDLIKNLKIEPPYFVFDMGDYFEKKGIVIKIYEGRVQVKISDLPPYFWHPDWLENLDSKLSIKLERNNICRKCNSPVYVGLNDIICPNCGRY